MFEFSVDFWEEYAVSTNIAKTSHSGCWVIFVGRDIWELLLCKVLILLASFLFQVSFGESLIPHCHGKCI